MDIKKWLAAGLAGAAFVAGGFVAGTLTDTPAAEAVTDDASAVVALLQETDDTPEEATAPRLGHRGHRGPGGGLGAIAEELGIDTDALREAFEDGATVGEALEAQGADLAEVTAALTAQAEERLADAVEDGRLTQDEADEKLTDLDERIEALLESTPADRAFARNHPLAARGIAEAAEIIGLETDEVADALRDGQSLAEIAEDNGVSRDELVDQLVDAATERINELVDKVPGEDAEG